MIAIGIDPGSSSGAIAIIRNNIVSICGMSRKTEHQINEFLWLATLEKEMGEPILAIIERVSPMPKQGVSSTFKFGTNYGFLRGVLVGNNVPFRDFIPKEWQKHYSMVKKKNEVDKAWKTRLLNVAQNLYPSAEIPLYAADAVLMAHMAKDLINKK